MLSQDSVNREQLNDEKYNAYCAGLYEGEGTVGFCMSWRRWRKNGKVYEYHTPEIKFSIEMCDIYPLELFQDHMDTGTISKRNRRNPNHKNIYVYRVYGYKNIKEVMEKIYDWLSPRRQVQYDESIKLYLEAREERGFNND